MVQINFAQKTVNVKIVYYGPGMSGKTTNLEVIHQRAPQGNRGDLTSISTDGDRTLFFDYMPLDLGTVAGMRTAFQLYTVPGQVYYNSTRKLVLQGVDGIIFVADSSAAMLNQNLESLRNLEENLNEYGKSLSTLPHVIQFNKRDLPDAMTVEELVRLMNPHRAPHFEAIANTGQGVFPTLKALAAGVLKNIMSESGTKGSYPSAPAPMPTPAQTGARPADAAGPRGGAPARPAAPFAQPGQGVPAGIPHQGYGAPGAPAHVTAAGTGYYPKPQGAPMHAPPPPPAHVPGAGLQLAQQPMHGGGGLQMAPQGRPPARPAPAMGAGEFGAAPPAPRTGPARAAPRPHGGAKARPAPARAAPPPKKARGRFGPILIVVGVGAGAALAWVLMNVL
jgi:signal recognition particle receptor subunit beta